MQYHVYDQTGLWVGEVEEPSPAEVEDVVVIDDIKSKSDDESYELVQLRGGPRHGEWNVIYLKGNNYIPAIWKVRSRPNKDEFERLEQAS